MASRMERQTNPPMARTGNFTLTPLQRLEMFKFDGLNYGQDKDLYHNCIIALSNWLQPLPQVEEPKLPTA